jgi:hypothetical protein
MGFFSLRFYPMLAPSRGFLDCGMDFTCPYPQENFDHVTDDLASPAPDVRSWLLAAYIEGFDYGCI